MGDTVTNDPPTDDDFDEEPEEELPDFKKKKCSACGATDSNGERNDNDNGWNITCLRCGFTRPALDSEAQDLERYYPLDPADPYKERYYRAIRRKEETSDKNKDPLPRVRWSSTSCRHYHDRTGYGITLENMTEKEQDAVQGAVIGAKWIRFHQGRLEVADVYEQPPTPLADPRNADEWQVLRDGKKGGVPVSFRYEHTRYRNPCDDAGGSILIHSLCGYNYTTENYKTVADTLLSWGFNCTRSSRGDDGHYWEVWYLPGLWCAKGELEKYIGKKKASYGVKEDESVLMDRVIRFIAQRVDFGSLDVLSQRMAMVLD